MSDRGFTGARPGPNATSFPVAEVGIESKPSHCLKAVTPHRIRPIESALFYMSIASDYESCDRLAGESTGDHEIRTDRAWSYYITPHYSNSSLMI